MKRKYLYIIGIIFSGIILLLLDRIIYYYSTNNNVIIQNTTNSQELKNGCLKATISVITFEIDRINNKLIEVNNSIIEGKEEILSELKILQEEMNNDLRKYQNMKIEDFQLGKKVEVLGYYFTEKVIIFDLFYTIPQSKSGPFYFIAGINGDNLNIIDTRYNYQMTLYYLYPRYYFPNILNEYVYIDGLEKKGLKS